MKIFHIVVVTLFLPIYLFSGFSGETLVRVPKGMRPIQELQVGDVVFGINEKSKLAITRISHTLVQKNKRCLDITIGHQTIRVARNQKFLNTKTNTWVKAKNVYVGDTVRIVQFPGAAKVTNIQECSDRMTLYDIRLEDDHVFCVTDLTIVVHNCPLFIVGLVWTFNTLADISFSGIVFGVVAPFVCATYALFVRKGEQSKGQLKVQVCSENMNKEAYIQDQLRDCGSQNSYQDPCERLQCASSSGAHQVFIGTCNGQSYDGKYGHDSTLVSGICAQTIPAIHPEQGACNYAASSSDKRIDDHEIEQDLLNGSYRKENSKQGSNGSKNIKRHTIKESEHEAGKACDSGICNPPAKGPHGYFIPSDKHKSLPCGNASAGPTWEEGQKALDQSVPVLDRDGNLQKYRVGIWDGHFIVFEPTSKDVWHAHYRPWNQETPNSEPLTDHMKKALVASGMVDNIRKGKILNDKK